MTIEVVSAATAAAAGETAAGTAAGSGGAAALSAASAAAPAAAVSGASAALPETGAALVLSKLAWFIVEPGFYIALAFGIIALALRLAAVFRAPALSQPAAPFGSGLYPSRRHRSFAALGDAFGMPQIRRNNPVFWIFLLVFHVGLLLLILGHFDILPGINIVPSSSKHMLGAGAVGLMVTIPIFYFLGRRFRSPVREISVPADYALLLLLLFTFLFGDLMSWGNSWTKTGFVMTKADFSRYFEGLARFSFEDPRAYLHGTHYHFLVIHVLLAEITLMILPFTKVVHAFLTIPVNMIRRGANAKQRDARRNGASEVSK